MLYRRLDRSWDYTFGNGAGNLLSGVDAVAQAIRSRLLLFLGEWWADRNDGLPLWQSILGYQGRDKDTVDRLIVERIVGTQGVKSITQFSSTYDANARQYGFTAAVDTIYGKAVVSSVPLMNEAPIISPTAEFIKSATEAIDDHYLPDNFIPDGD